MGHCGGNIVLLTDAIAVLPLAPTHAPKIETQCTESLFLVDFRNRCDHMVVHFTAIKRVGVRDNDSLVMGTFGVKAFEH